MLMRQKNVNKDSLLLRLPYNSPYTVIRDTSGTYGYSSIYGGTTAATRTINSKNCVGSSQFKDDILLRVF